MSLTAEEIAMCRDALLEAGVPMRVVAELVGDRIQLMGFGDRIHVVRCERRISMPELLLTEQKMDENRYTKDVMYMELSKKLIEDAVCRVSENPTYDALGIRLELTVLTPPGWKPPAKVPR